MGRTLRRHQKTERLNGMNRTMTVNVGGYAFTMEENAARMLETYLDEIRGNFTENGNAPEIMSDIENRIGELLNETKGGYEFITAGMVETVQQRVGKPSDMRDDNSGENTGEAGDGKIKKRLYRNVDEKNIGGVCSGLSEYFGIDVVWFRILWLALCVGGLFLDGRWIFRDGILCLYTILAYCVLWICIPEARTVRQKCEMRGMPSNLPQYRDYVPDSQEERGGVKRYHRPFLGKFLGVFAGTILFLVGCCFTVAGVGTPIGLSFVGDNVYNINISHVDDDFVPYAENAVDMLTQPAFWWLTAIFNILLGIGLCYAGIRLIFDFNPPKWKPGLFMLALWFVSLVALTVYCALFVTGVITPAP